jgi:alkylation response protein AidB-like acyl-CoA dehydrogenase
MLAAVEQLAWGEASAAAAVALHTQVTSLVARHGRPAARERWLSRLSAGELIGCAQAAHGEEGVKARHADGGWVLHGSVPWVGNARPAGLLALRASADGGPLLCLVPLADDAVESQPPAATMGLRPLALRTVTLQGVRLSGDAVVAGPGEAQEPLRELARGAALLVAAVAAGIGQAALDHARDYADVREQFGHRLREFDGIRLKLADMAIRVAGARALRARAAAQPDAAAASVAKVAAAEAAMFASTQAVQVFGGYGYMREYPVEKLMRDAKAMSLLGGADDRHRGQIAEWLYAD